MLKNATTLAIVAVHREENESLKIGLILNGFSIHSLPAIQHERFLIGGDVAADRPQAFWHWLSAFRLSIAQFG